MTHRMASFYFLAGAATFLGTTLPASAEWQLTITGPVLPGTTLVDVTDTNMSGVDPGDAGSMGKGLGQWSSDPEVYYAASVSGHVNVPGNRKSVPKSATITGDIEWRWTWVPEDENSSSDYLWDYSVKGYASVAAEVSLDDNGGYGKAEASAWVKLEAAAVNVTARSESVAVAAVAEVRADGEAITGVGVEIGSSGGGASISWNPGGTQLEAYADKTEYVTLSDIKRPGSACWIQMNTSASGTLHEFHDTENHGNECSASTLLLPVSLYANHRLNAPYYSPEE